MTARDHNKLLSIFFFIHGGLQLLGGIIIVLIYGILGGALLAGSRREEDQVIGGILLVVAVVVGVIMLIFAGIYLFGGLKMLREQKVGRTLGIVGSIIALLGFPLGTALGVYGLWFLFGDEGRGLYGGIELDRANYTPPPNSWQ